MTSKILYGLITLTTVLLAVANLALQEYWFVVITIVSGATWLLLHVKTKESPNSVFFVLFMGLTIIGSLRGLPIPLMLLALSSNLAAWDLSRFQARISYEEDSTSKTAMEVQHLQKLAVPLAAGLLIALIPSFIQISLNFVVFLVVLLLMMLTFRRSVLYLRKESDIKN